MKTFYLSLIFCGLQFFQLSIPANDLVAENSGPKLRETIFGSCHSAIASTAYGRVHSFMAAPLEQIEGTDAKPNLLIDTRVAYALVATGRGFDEFEGVKATTYTPIPLPVRLPGEVVDIRGLHQNELALIQSRAEKIGSPSFLDLYYVTDGTSHRIEISSGRKSASLKNVQIQAVYEDLGLIVVTGDDSFPTEANPNPNIYQTRMLIYKYSKEGGIELVKKMNLAKPLKRLSSADDHWDPVIFERVPGSSHVAMINREAIFGLLNLETLSFEADFDGFFNGQFDPVYFDGQAFIRLVGVESDRTYIPNDWVGTEAIEGGIRIHFRSESPSFDNELELNLDDQGCLHLKFRKISPSGFEATLLGKTNGGS